MVAKYSKSRETQLGVYSVLSVPSGFPSFERVSQLASSNPKITPDILPRLINPPARWLWEKHRCEPQILEHLSLDHRHFDGPFSPGLRWIGGNGIEGALITRQMTCRLVLKDLCGFHGPCGR